MTDVATHLLANNRWLRCWRDRGIAERLETFLSLPLVCCAFLDPERDVPEFALRRLRILANNGSRLMTAAFRHPVQEALNKLVYEGKSYEAEVRLGEIRGISATKGGCDSRRMGFCMNLDRLPETIRLSKGENYGPLGVAEMARLRTAVRKELPFYDKRLRLTLQTWDGAYIVHNEGASRRFALLRRLSRDEYFPAEVRPINLSEDALHLLREHWRVVVLAQGPGTFAAVHRLRDLSKEHFWWAHDGSREEKKFLLAIPYPHRASKRFIEPLIHLHRKLDETGTFDIGRYLTEQISVAKQKHALLEWDKR